MENPKMNSSTGIKFGMYYFRSSHIKRILVLFVITLFVVFWVVHGLPATGAVPQPALILTDFEPLKLPEGFHSEINTNETSLKYNQRQFILDGKPITILSGGMHYFRIPSQYWEDRMKKMKACGLNTLETYVAWNKHEEIKGHITFEDNLDLRRYIKLAQALGLYVILRPGPYICSEWDLGGLPSWLLHDPDMKLRSNYPPYMQAVESFFQRLLPKVVDLQHSMGGPIIMFQVENEFGSYSSEVEHLYSIKKILEKNGVTELLVVSESMGGFQSGVLTAPFPPALLTLNFQKVTDAELLMEAVQRYDPNVPFMVMEFWTGWFDHWGREHQAVSSERIMESLHFILSHKSSINLYMFHGGTNFGFFAGANYFSEYRPDVTSYDYGALLSEAGDVNRKFSYVKNMLVDLVLKPAGMPSLPEPPGNIEKANYGELQIESYLSWENLLKTVQPISSKELLEMEMLDINKGGGQGYGYIVYRKSLSSGGLLTFGQVRDRAQVLVNGLIVSTTTQSNKTNELKLPEIKEPSTLDIMVENQGRVNYVNFESPILNDQRKGLKGDVKLADAKLTDWQIYPLEFNGPMLHNIAHSEGWKTFVEQQSSPTMYKGSLTIPSEPKDTFVYLDGWKKGVVFVNGHNLGRYWHIGPQGSLYLPAPFLRKGKNEVYIFEEDSSKPTISFRGMPSLEKI